MPQALYVLPYVFNLHHHHSMSDLQQPRVQPNLFSPYASLNEMEVPPSHLRSVADVPHMKWEVPGWRSLSKQNLHTYLTGKTSWSTRTRFSSLFPFSRFSSLKVSENDQILFINIDKVSIKSFKDFWNLISVILWNYSHFWIWHQTRKQQYGEIWLKINLLKPT